MGLSGRKKPGCWISVSPEAETATRRRSFASQSTPAGNVVGSARQVDGRQVAFFWSPIDGFTPLGDISTNADNGNSAYAINDQDQVTGNLVVSNHRIIYHAFLWSPGMEHPRDLGWSAAPNSA